ncbi:hypothetical protein CSUI_001152 [Cystoisospora suis]|uniref:Transmembrane protein n=1 Tax=Cystoisospora suis TaxID=483139 RepID=A0A2C6LDS9_9APIC|nr:hypothetical protein CSUI_001152 [Cystoisospora suis]
MGRRMLRVVFVLAGAKSEGVSIQSAKLKRQLQRLSRLLSHPLLLIIILSLRRLSWIWRVEISSWVGMTLALSPLPLLLPLLLLLARVIRMDLQGRLAASRDTEKKQQEIRMRRRKVRK